MGVRKITVTMDAAHTATAHYVKQYYLKVISPYGTTSGEGWYDEDATAYAGLYTGLVEVDGTRHLFVKWTVDGTDYGTDYAKSNPITMNAPKTAVAVWKTQHYLTVTDNIGGLSGVSSQSGWYDEGESVTLTAPTGPITGPDGYQYYFLKWQVDSEEKTENTITVQMDVPYTATAVYVTPQRLDFSWSGPTTVTKGSTGTYWANYTITANVDLTKVKVQGGIGAKAKNIKIYLDGKLVDELSSLTAKKWTAYKDGTPFPAGVALELDVSRVNNVFVLTIDSMKAGESHTLSIQFDWTFTSTGTQKITGEWSAVCTSESRTLKTPYTNVITVTVTANS